MVTGVVPTAGGVREIRPVVGLMTSLLGRVFELHEYGGVPPVACTVPTYSKPVTPWGNAAVVITRLGITVIENGRLVVCCGVPESVNCRTKLYVPAVVGTPLIVPRDGSRIRPGGSAPEAIPHWSAPGLPPIAIN